MSNINTLYFIHHSHTDIGYTHDQPIVFDLHGRFLDEALRLADDQRSVGSEAGAANRARRAATRTARRRRDCQRRRRSLWRRPAQRSVPLRLRQEVQALPRRLGRTERRKVETAFTAYLDTIPEDKRFDRALFYEVRDMVGKSGFMTIDISNPLKPKPLGVAQIPRGSHNMTVHPSGIILGLREFKSNEGEAFSPDRTGIDHLSFGVGSRAELEKWAALFEEKGVNYTPLIDSDYGHHVNFKDPDNIALEMFCLLES